MAAIAPSIKPAVSLRVMGDGSVRPFVPNVIQFRDGDLLRPVAPFFELWASSMERQQPVNQRLLDRSGRHAGKRRVHDNRRQPEGAATHRIGRLRLYRAE